MEMKHLKKHIRALATLPETDARVVSCYVELEKGRLKNPQAFRRGLGVIKKSLTRTERQPVEESLSRIEAYLAEELLGEAKGAATLSAFVEKEQGESFSAVETLHGAIRINGLGLSGEHTTLRALKRGQGDMLVLAKGYDSEAREEMVRLATATGCEVEIVEQSDLLVQLGGVGCLLRYRIAGDTIDVDERKVEGVSAESA